MDAERASALILYDGLCGFCNQTVQWLLKLDRHDRLRFAPQQSALAREILASHGLFQSGPLAAGTVFFVRDWGLSGERIFERSDAGVQTLLVLGWPWKPLAWALRAIPRVIRDFGYSFVAHNRFTIVGRLEACPIPTPAQRAKFVGVRD